MSFLPLHYATAFGAACLLAAAPCAAQRPAAPTKTSTTVPSGQAHLLAHEAEVDALLKKLTLEEKVHLLHANSAFAAGGIERLGIPEIMTSDGPHGVRP